MPETEAEQERKKCIIALRMRGGYNEPCYHADALIVHVRFTANLCLFYAKPSQCLPHWYGNTNGILVHIAKTRNEKKYIAGAYFQCKIRSINQSNNQSIIQSIKRKKMCLNGFSFCFPSATLSFHLALPHVVGIGDAGEFLSKKEQEWDSAWIRSWI